MARLRSARLTDATLVSQIDDFLGELEGDLCTIFGFTEDSDITVNPLGPDHDGRVTNAQLLARASLDTSTRTLGLQTVNSTNSYVSYMRNVLASVTKHGGGATNTNIFSLGSFDPSTTHNTDATTTHLSILSGESGQLWGYLFTSAAQGLVPKGSGNSDEYLRSDGVFVNPNNFAVSCCATTPAGLGGAPLVVGIQQIPYWGNEVFDASGLFSPGNQGITIGTTGKYAVGVHVWVFPDMASTGDIRMSIIRDRSSVLTEWGVVELPFSYPDMENNFQSDTIVDCNAGDVIKVALLMTSSAATTYTIPNGELNARFWVSRVV